jgi:hypothetical protein
LAILSGHDRVKIKKIIISGNAAVSADEILTIASRDLIGRYWSLFAKSNSLIFPRWQIKEDILTEIKTVKDLDISWEDWQTISIALTERKPQAVWCGSDPTINPSCSFLDKSGLIYRPAPIFSGNLFIKNYGQPTGDFFLPTEKYLVITDLINQLIEKNLRVIQVFFDGVDYRFTLETGPIIIFSSTGDPSLSFRNLWAAIATNNLDLIQESASINYVDLRFENKIVIGKK